MASLVHALAWFAAARLRTAPGDVYDEHDDDVHLPFSSVLAWIPSLFHPSLRSLLIAALRLGPRPKHVAFIMDGNRRSARVRNLPVRVGHEEGFDALKRVLSFLLKLEIPHVTVYAFSIENFNRDPKEVDALMGMARTRLVEICQHGCAKLPSTPLPAITTDPYVTAHCYSSTACRSASWAGGIFSRSTSKTRAHRQKR